MLGTHKGKQTWFDGVDDLGQASDLVVVLLLRRRPVRMADRERFGMFQVITVKSGVFVPLVVDQGQ
jgi:hypothetical protein